MPLRKIDTVLRWRKTGRNEFNEQSYGTPELLALRWDDVSKLSVDDKGEEFMSQGAVFGDVAEEILVEDRLALTADIGADIETSFIVRMVKHSRNSAGTRSLYKATLTK
jgi:hypothetical protein